MSDCGFEVSEFAGRGRLPHELFRMRRTIAALRPDVLFYNDPHALTAAGLASLGLHVPARIAARRVDFPLRSVARYRQAVDYMICVSNAVREICVQSGLDRARLKVVHDGVDPQRMKHGSRERGRASLGVSDDQCVILTVAKLTDHKGHRFLMRALPDVLRQRPDVTWIIAGDGHLRDTLRLQAAELGVLKHVRFLGHRQDIPDLMAAAELFVVPSHMEGLCSSIIDAMLVNLPVVATRAGGIPDLLDGRSPSDPTVGWLTRPRDVAGLRDAILEALGDPVVRRQRVIAAARRAQREFTAECMVRRTIEVFQQAVINKRTLRRAG